VLVAHDYGATVALELLARQSDGASAARFDAAVLLNGGLYHELHRPRPIHKLLLNRLTGPLVARLLDERRFVRAMAEVFGPANPPGRDELREHWRAVAAGGGHRIGHRLIHYIRDRRRHAARWEAALERPPAPLTFAWGLSDPISGAHMLERIRRRCAGAEVRAWDGVGHYPQLEAADRVADAILDAARRAGVAPA
jgi:pimeloyl-ACP methyl ester carboxylesterase